MNALMWVAVTGIAGVGLHLLASAMERRGWIYYRHTKPPAGTASLAAMQVMAAFEPEIHHVVIEHVVGDLRSVDDETGADDHLPLGRSADSSSG